MVGPPDGDGDQNGFAPYNTSPFFYFFNAFSPIPLLKQGCINCISPKLSTVFRFNHHHHRHHRVRREHTASAS